MALTGGNPAHQSELLAYNIYYTFYGRSGPQWRASARPKAVISLCDPWWPSPSSSCGSPVRRRYSSDKKNAALQQDLEHR